MWRLPCLLRCVGSPPDSGRPGRSPRGEQKHVGWGGCGEAGGLPSGWGKGMREREEKQQIHLPFAALDESSSHQGLRGLANALASPLMRRRLQRPLMAAQVTASDSTSQASHLLSGSQNQAALPWADLSAEGPGSTSRLRPFPAREPGPLNILDDRDQFQGPQRKPTSCGGDEHMGVGGNDSEFSPT